ncbi:MAG: GntR family transcriptional regulator [Anderseniella sp.]|jgi:DNA-binding GntR family transcriptional regulator|nr:GntR family transcriptional regulator [Anderseniella sp.]
MSNRLKLKPVGTNFSLKEHIYEALKEAISNVDIYAADANLRLDERALAEQLGISRTPVREALSRLEQEGFVEVLARRGVFIRRRTLEDVLDMIVVWAALESMAARMAAEKATNAQIAALRRHAARHSESSAQADLSEYSDANIRFHQMILEMSGCKLLAQMADGLFVHMHAVRRRAIEENNRASRSVVDHLGIIEALEERDAELAAQLVRKHTMRLHDHVRRAWKKLEHREQEDNAG